MSYSLALVWAYIGIAVMDGNLSLGSTSALVTAGLILAILIIVLVRKYRKQPAAP